MITIKDISGNYSYPYKDGLFGFLNEDNIVQDVSSCREEFHNYWRGNKKSFLFGGLSKCDLGSVKKFWNTIEEKLGKDFSVKFETTNIKNTFVFYPSKGWTENFLTKNVLSLLIRYSFVYYTDDIGEYFQKYALLRSDSIRNALLYFLEGNVKPNFRRFSFSYLDSGGFCRQFSDKTMDYIKSKLVKP